MAMGPLVPPRHLPAAASSGDAERDTASELLCARCWVNPKGKLCFSLGDFQNSQPLLKDLGARMGAAPQKGHQILRASVSLPAK